MIYSEDGSFTREQKRWAQNIARNLQKLRESGCVIIGKENFLGAYIKEELDNVEPDNGIGSGYPIPILYCGDIDGCRSNETDYFKFGHINNEIDNYNTK